jgi:hypothetical protein
MKLKFPTRKAFMAWFAKRRKRAFGNSTISCPLAGYLRAHGARHPVVWADRAFGAFPDGMIVLPKWAKRFVREWDEGVR